MKFSQFLMWCGIILKKYGHNFGTILLTRLNVMYRLFVFESVQSILSVTKHGFEGCRRKFNYIYQEGYGHSEFT